jgi:hypothetical protein
MQGVMQIMMKTTALFIVLTASAVFGQVKQDSTATPATATVTESTEKAVYRPETVKVVGTLDYGQSSASVNCSDTYSAFVFEGYARDKVEIRVSGQGQPFVALADSSLHEVTSGTSQLQASLPDHGPAIEAWYIIFRNPEGSGDVTVQVSKIGNQSKTRQDQTEGQDGGEGSAAKTFPN